MLAEEPASDWNIIWLIFFFFATLAEINYGFRWNNKTKVSNLPFEMIKVVKSWGGREVFEQEGWVPTKHKEIDSIRSRHEQSRASAVIGESNPSTALPGSRKHRWHIQTSIIPHTSETLQNSKSLNVWSKEPYSRLPEARITHLLVRHPGVLWVYAVLTEHPWLLPSTTWRSPWLCRLSPPATGVREQGRWWSLSARDWWRSSRRTVFGLTAPTSMTRGWCSTSTRRERRSSSWGSFTRASGSPVSKRSTYRVWRHRWLFHVDFWGLQTCRMFK